MFKGRCYLLGYRDDVNVWNSSIEVNTPKSEGLRVCRG